MAIIIKKHGKQVCAWGLPSKKQEELTALGLIRCLPDGNFELFSQESTDHGEVAHPGDFFKIDKAGYPYPNSRDWFLKNHRHIEGDTYEQLPKPLQAWESADPITDEVKYLIQYKGLVLSPDKPDQYFGAMLWGAWLTAASDAVLVFYSVSRDEDGNITDADFNFVARAEFDESYDYFE